MTNPILKKLGLSDNSRAVVLHADDIGMLQATIPAYRDLVARGSISAASVMAPCAWFPAAAAAIRETAHLPQADVGVHLAHTSEWELLRWGPLSSAGRVATHGLIDDDGYFHRQTEPVQQQAAADTVLTESELQIERANQAGIDVTHIDTHMGAMFHPRFLINYVGLGLKYRLPVFLPRPNAERFKERGLDAAEAKAIVSNAERLEAQGLPFFDGVNLMPLRDKTAFRDRLEHAKRLLNEASAGLHYLIIHPAVESPELRAVAPDWEARVMDYTLFMSDSFQKVVEESGVTVIGMRCLRSILRGETT